MMNLLVRVACWSAGHPWRAVAGWILFVAVCLGLGIAVGGNAATSADFRVGEAGRAEAMAEAGGLRQRPLERVLISAKDGAAVDPVRLEAAARDVTARMGGLPEVESVASPVRSADGRALRVDVTMRGAELDGKKHVDPLLAQTAAVQRAHPDLVVDESGSPSISKDVQAQRGDDLARTEMLALPITLLVLLLVFRSVVMAAVPVLLAISSIIAGIGLAMLASHAFPDAGVGTHVILLIGMAVGVDYTLFFLKREREERARSGGRPSPAALAGPVAATAGRTVVVSGLAVAASSATLYLADDVIFDSLATGAITIALVAVVSSLTVLPALSAVLGDRAERRRARRGVPMPPARETGRITGAVLRAAARRPAPTLALATALLLALAAPLLGLKLTDVGRETYSRDLPAVAAFHRVNDVFPELRSTHRVVVRADPARADEVARALDALARRAGADPLFTGSPAVLFSADRAVGLLELSVPHYPSTPQAQESLRNLRRDHVPGALGAPAGVEIAVTGDVARYADYPGHQKDRMPMIIGALLLVTFAITVRAFGSPVLGLLGALLNLLSAAASLGLLTLVFQGTWAEGLLGFTSMGSLGSRVPLFLFVILFALSMDYQMFVISRIQEAVRGGTPARRAVLEGIGRSASVVTSAAVVMVTVFASFVGLHLIEMKQMGFGLAVAVLLDAFVVRLVILPAAMLLLGEAAWWPARRRAAVPEPRDRRSGT